jgi:hypothetical protein
MAGNSADQLASSPVPSRACELGARLHDQECGLRVVGGKLAGVPAQVSAVAGMGYVFSSDDLQARLLRPVVRGLARLTLGGSNARLILQNADDVDFFERNRLVHPGQFG